CPGDCSGHGVCSSGVCQCDNLYGAVDCSMKESCPSGCSGHGTCNEHNAKCTCSPGWSGDACSIFSC
ncbi:hypothetical protein GUITHDRAFT_47948, partial [Guillardia theta CCMP2712]